MKLKQISFKVISTIMVLSIMFGICATMVNAIDWTSAERSFDNTKEHTKINYVSLGDSMTNGYGLEGYDAEAGVYDYGFDSYANKFAEYLAKQNGWDGDPDTLSKYVNHSQLALSAARPEDINFLLRLDYESKEVSDLLDKYPDDDLVCWNCSDHSGVAYEDIVYCAVCKWDHIDLPGYGVQRGDGKSVDDYYAWWTLVHGENWSDLIGAGDFWTWKELVEDYRFGTVATYIKSIYGTDAEKKRAEELMASRPAKPRDDGSNGEETCYVAEHYQKQVAEADVISLALGNGNFGVWLMGRITSVLMDYDGVARAGVYDTQEVLDTCSPEFKEQLNNLLVNIDPIINDYIAEMMGDNLNEDEKEAIKHVCVYGVVSFVVNYRHTIDRILELNPDAEIVLTGLMNTYAGDSANAPEGTVTIGNILDEIFPLLNAYIVGLPTYLQATDNELYKDAKFYYAEEYEIECLIHNFGDESFYNWEGVSRLRFVTGVVGECDCANSCIDAEECPDFDEGIFWELLHGFNMGGITIQYIDKDDIVYYESLTDVEKVTFAIENKDKAGSIAVYLAIEDAICKSGKLAPVTLSTLTGLELGNPAILNKALSNFSAEQEKIIADYYDEAIAGLKNYGIENPTETQKNDMSMILSLPVALSNALWTDADLCSMLAVVARNKLGNGLGAHPSVTGHRAFSEAIIDAYNADGIPADVVIDKIFDLYGFATKYGVLDDYTESELINIIFAYLESNDQLDDYLTGSSGDSIKKLIIVAAALTDIVAENYDVVYEYAYAELKAAGVIDEIKAELESVEAELLALADELDAKDANSIYANTRAELAKELRLTAETVDAIIEIIDQDTVGEHTKQLLEELRDKVVQHGNSLINIADALGKLSVEYTDIVIADILRAADSAAAAIKAAADAKIAELEKELEDAEESAKNALLAEIAKVEAKLIADLAALNEQVDAQIAEIRAELEANNVDVELVSTLSKHLVGLTVQMAKDIDESIVDYFRKNLGDVYYEFATTIVDAARYYIINSEVEDLEEAIAILKEVVIAAVEEAGDDVVAIIEAFVNEAVKVSYTHGKDSYLVSLNGGSAYYAQLLAQFLGLDDDHFGSANWSDIDYELLEKADLITIGYDENELTGFAVSQLFGYLANYVDVDVRNSILAYLSAMISKLEENDLNLREFEPEIVQALEDAIDELVADYEMQDMDWESVVGSENLHYVDEAREQIKEELISSGVMEYYHVEVNVLDLIYDNIDSLDNPEISQIFKMFGKGFFANILGDSAIYTIDVPVVDSLVYAAESFLYNYVSFNVTYGKLIVELQEINPEASVLLLGYYNAFDGLSLDMGDVSVDVGEAYQIFVDITSIQPFLFALYYPNVAYVDITDAETVFESYVKAGLVEGDITSFLTLYLSDSTITDISTEGQEYVFNQILSALVVNCVHEYDNACDVDCNRCGMVRDVPDHVYSNPCDVDCSECGEVRVVSGHIYDSCTDTKCNLCGQSRPEETHVFDGCTDTDCNKCGFVRPAGEHVFDGCVDAVCNNCGATRESGSHVYDNCDDLDCNNCGYIRPESSHVYTDCTDTDCNKCGVVREAGEHAYSGCTDTDCDKCGAAREAGEHEYDGCLDAECNKCDYVRPNAEHKFANACDKDCDLCGETREVSGHIYTDCVDVDCDLCGEKRSAGKHNLDSCDDTTCSDCGATVEVTGHSYGEWKVEVEATKNEEGKKVRTCKDCGHQETEAIPVVNESDSGAGVTFAIVIGAIIVADVIAFAVYWFVIQKKTFADLTASFSKKKAAPKAEEKPENEQK